MHGEKFFSENYNTSAMLVDVPPNEVTNMKARGENKKDHAIGIPNKFLSL